MQCVSSCSSTDIIEHGIFMTKKLYLYNNICYDICPKGSIPDDINSICVKYKDQEMENDLTMEVIDTRYGFDQDKNIFYYSFKKE